MFDRPITYTEAYWVCNVREKFLNEEASEKQPHPCKTRKDRQSFGRQALRVIHSGHPMSRNRTARVLLSATAISTLIQLPLILLMNQGVHSQFGWFGYLFYYPWIIFLGRLGPASWRWENNIFVFEACLFILQSLVLVSLISLLLVFRNARSKR